MPPTPATPTPRPIPTLPVQVKVITTAITKSASTILIIFVAITLILFALFRYLSFYEIFRLLFNLLHLLLSPSYAWNRIYDVARVIQMNMEIALILAHIILLSPSASCCRRRTHVGTAQTFQSRSPTNVTRYLTLRVAKYRPITPQKSCKGVLTLRWDNVDLNSI